MSFRVSYNTNLSPLLAADYSQGQITQTQYNRYLETSRLDQEDKVALLRDEIAKRKRGNIIFSAIIILLVLIITFMVLRKKT